MDEITLDDQTYVSSKRAAQITGYAKDYVGQLCREGRVEARLVGRNWYVLESSIREHRFGSTTSASKHSDSAEAVSTAPEKAWESTNYTHESSPVLLPELESHENQQSVDILSNTDIKPRNTTFERPVATPVSSQVVKDMQSAWHDWFTKTDELAVSEEILLENPESEEESEENVPITRQEIIEKPALNELGSETTPITLEKVAEAIEKRAHVDPEDESVTINRSFVSPIYTKAPPVQSFAQATQPVLAAQGRIVRERRVIRKRKPSRVIQTLLLLIGVLAVATAVIGSGKLDPFLSTHNVNIKAIEFLGGESTVQK